MKKHKQIFTETYTVHFIVQNDKGFYENRTEKVIIKLTDNLIEKDNHALAENFLLKKFPKAQIIKVVYN